MDNRNNTVPVFKASGFTLIEMMVVVVIIGLLAALVGPNIMKNLGSAQSKTAKIEVESLGNALDTFRLDVGRYPNNSEGLEALVSQPAGASNWNGPYLKKGKLPTDPWNNAYQYRFPGQHGAYDLMSLGADNSEGGEGENADQVSWE